MKLPTLFALAFALFAFALVPAQAQTVKSGVIKGQSVKWTTGRVAIVKSGNGHELRLGSDFKTKRGPALVVYLGNEKPSKRIGKLKSIEGAQSYKIPANVDIGKYSRVFIHCVPFNATFGVGTLR